MTATPPTGLRPVPASRATRTVLAAGVAVSSACFALALLLEFAGRPRGGGSAFDLRSVAASAAAFETWGWATIGTFAVIVTPVLALVATALEFRAVADRRTALVAVGVLAILGIGLLVALWR